MVVSKINATFLQSSSIIVTVTLLGETILAPVPTGGRRVMMKYSIPSPDLSVRSVVAIGSSGTSLVNTYS